MPETDYVVDVRRAGLFTWTYQVNDANRPDLWGMATIAFGKAKTRRGAMTDADRAIERDKKRRTWYNEGSTYIVRSDESVA